MDVAEGVSQEQKQPAGSDEVHISTMEEEYLSLVEKQKAELEQLADQLNAMIHRLDTIRKSFPGQER